MKKDIEIGTIYKNTRHGHCEFMLVENEFVNPATYYESERLPWMCAKQVCCICGFYNGHKHGCNIKCQASARKDGKDVYWKLVFVGKKWKKPVTDENIGQFVPAWEFMQYYRKGVHDEHPCVKCEKYLTPGEYTRHACTADCEAKIAYDKKYAEDIWHQRNCTNHSYYEAHKDEHPRYKVNQ